MTAVAATKLPKAYEERDESRLPESPPHFIALDYAEPSPIMVGFQKAWKTTKRLFKITAVVVALGAYPAMIVLSSTVNDRPIEIAADENWAVPAIGVAVHKVARELEGPGWAANRPIWHPQARLSALPAWQAATSEALAEHVTLMAGIARTDGAPDSDLSAAARLLVNVENEPMRPRLTAAAQALNRFDTRASRGLAMRPMPEETLPSELALFAGWAATDRAALSDRINAEQTSWPASKEDIAAFYAAKARAHVAHEIFLSGKRASYRLGDTRLSVAAERVEASWGRAARMKPLFVTNQTGSAALTSNHLASMAYYLLEAEEASNHLAELMAQSSPQPERVEDTAALQAEPAEEAAQP